ncbi:hypothetical protein [Leucobacter denitrificans]|uniref:Gluconate 2-dehydrogenase subunit 3 family protein n=1 Tax=Leucobacter denitrificans TaxID=683042 RepID=A0A7G9S299_9MICO|nr:hypothetical protein [Leucobacter denitrificans]QNN61974.1 hypothetical protein H9L06_06500 [Leucobacter denitrificans]
MCEEVEVTMDDVTRQGVARVMDVLLPGTEVLPRATAVDAQGELLDRVLRADPKLEPIVRRCGEQAAQTSEISLADVEQWMGEDTERLVFALHAAYYMSKDVRQALNYPGQGRVPVAEATPDQLVSPELIAPVIERGPIYVPTPE